MTQNVSNSSLTNSTFSIGSRVAGTMAVLGGLIYMYSAGSQSQQYSATITAIQTLDAIKQEIKSEKEVNLENIAAMRAYLTNVKIAPEISLAVKKYNKTKTIPTATNALTVIDNAKTCLAETPTGSEYLAWGLGLVASGLYLVSTGSAMNRKE